MATKPSQPADEAARTDRMERTDRTDQPGRRGPEPCSTPIDRNAPAGARNSLGAKSDCNGRPTTDDSVVEAMDERDPALPPDEPRDAPR